MLNYYQPSIWPFLRWQRYTLPSNIKQYYFFSFEDGLWELLYWLKVKPTATILIPDFYCMDVVNNIKSHGYTVVFYPLDEHFQSDQAALHLLVQKYQPAVVVIFQACGIRNTALDDGKIFQVIPPSTILIEDNVQSLIDPTRLLITRKNHIVMDSLRKVSPLPGSMMYGLTPTFRRNGEDWQPLQHRGEWKYLAAATLWYFLFRFILWMGIVTKFPWLVKTAHEVILKKHDDIIGDSKRGYLGWKVWAIIHQHVNFSKVAVCKLEQVTLYQRSLDELLKKPAFQKYFYRIACANTDLELLHVFPIGLQKPLSASAQQWLHEQGAIIWQKFPDAPWSTKRGVLFLPLGFHVTKTEIVYMCDVLAKLPQHWS